MLKQLLGITLLLTAVSLARLTDVCAEQVVRPESNGCQPRVVQVDDCKLTVTGQFYFRVKKCKTVLKRTPYEETRYKDCLIYDPETCTNEWVRVPYVATGHRMVETDVEYTVVECRTVTLPVADLDGAQACQCNTELFLRSDPEPQNDPDTSQNDHQAVPRTQEGSAESAVALGGTPKQLIASDLSGDREGKAGTTYVAPPLAVPATTEEGIQDSDGCRGCAEAKVNLEQSASCTRRPLKAARLELVPITDGTDATGMPVVLVSH